MPSLVHPHLMAALAALVAFALLPMEAAGQDYVSGGPAVEARYLFFLGEFIRWPSDRAPAIDRPLTVGFFGRGRVEDYFVEANQTRGAGRQVEVIHVNSTADMRRCHIVFFEGTDGARLAAMLKEARRRNVLSVGESESFIRLGGMINFSSRGGRVQPQVNLDALRHARLEPDSRFLRSAEIVSSNVRRIEAGDPAL